MPKPKIKPIGMLCYNTLPEYIASYMNMGLWAIFKLEEVQIESEGFKFPRYILLEDNLTEEDCDYKLRKYQESIPYKEDEQDASDS